jgi:hypothetical protein
MRRTRIFCQSAVLLACVGLIVPEHVLAATTTAEQPMIADVALQSGGTLTGQVVDSQGQAKPQANVNVYHQDQQVASTKTDENGNFSVRGLRGGVHTVAAGEGVATYRFWAPNTAPPQAQSQAMLVADQNVTRGNIGNGGFVAFITNPWVLAGLVATAIAVPIALNNSGGGGGGSGS